MLKLMRTSKFHKIYTQHWGWGVQTIPNDWLLRRKKYLLKSNSLWMIPSILELYRQSRLWRVWQCCLQMSVCGDDASPWDHSNPRYNNEWLLWSSEPPILPGPSTTENSQHYCLRTNWPRQVLLHSFSRWPCEESAKIMPIQQQAVFQPPKLQNKQYAFGSGTF